MYRHPPSKSKIYKIIFRLLWYLIIDFNSICKDQCIMISEWNLNLSIQLEYHYDTWIWFSIELWYLNIISIFMILNIDFDLTVSSCYISVISQHDFNWWKSLWYLILWAWYGKRASLMSRVYTHFFQTSWKENGERFKAPKRKFSWLIISLQRFRPAKMSLHSTTYCI